MPVQRSASQSKNGLTSEDPPIHESQKNDLSPTADDANPQVALLRLLVKRAVELIHGKQTKECVTNSGK